jgi:hypothetical protein
MLKATAIGLPPPAAPLCDGAASRLMSMLAADGGEVDLSDLALKKIAKKPRIRPSGADQLVLIKTGWNRSKASRILNVSYNDPAAEDR